MIVSAAADDTLPARCCCRRSRSAAAAAVHALLALQALLNASLKLDVQPSSLSAALQAAFVRAAALGPEAALNGLSSQDTAARAWECRWLGALGLNADHLKRLEALAKDTSPRVRVEAIRALSRIPSDAAAEAIAAERGCAGCHWVAS